MDLGRPLARHNIRRPSEVLEQELQLVDKPTAEAAEAGAEEAVPAEERTQG